MRPKTSPSGQQMTLFPTTPPAGPMLSQETRKALIAALAELLMSAAPAAQKLPIKEERNEPED